MKNTTSHITDTMLRKAAELWNIPLSEIKSTLDPTVLLLLSACACEIEQIHSEIAATRIQSTEQLIQLMTPGSAYGAQPAHSIAHAIPTEGVLRLPKTYQFYTPRPIETEQATSASPIFFSPIAPHTLVDASLRYTLIGHTLSEYIDKNTLAVVPNTYQAPPATLHLGITTLPEQGAIEGLSLYVELQEITHRELFYHHLKHATFYIHDQVIPTKTGLHASQNADDHLFDELLQGSPTRSHAIEKEIMHYYDPFFISCTEAVDLSTPSQLPEPITQALQATGALPTEEITWITIVFPGVVNHAILDHVFCSFNAFPVINRKWNQLQYHLREFIHIIPMITPDLFLDIQTITNAQGQRYDHTAQMNPNTTGTYRIRSEQSQKLDTRSAKEHIRHLLTLLKDESASFSFMNKQFLKQQLKDFNQNIARLEQRLGEAPREGRYCQFIQLSPHSDDEFLLLSYWTTDGEIANTLRSGASLLSYEGGDLQKDRSELIRPIFGGKDQLTMDERMYAYRQALLTKNRLVSKEDIKALCFATYGNHIKTVTIQKSFTKDIALYKGLVQCIEIKIHPNPNSSLAPEEWDYMDTTLLATIQEQAISVFPYVINRIGT